MGADLADVIAEAVEDGVGDGVAAVFRDSDPTAEAVRQAVLLAINQRLVSRLLAYLAGQPRMS
jgi:class 3 adenylate cyclase